MKNSWTGGETTSQSVDDGGGSLAAAVHRCDPGAFERLIQRFERPLFTYADGILQNAFDAQEVVQDALLRAHKALTKQYDEERVAALALRPWLFRTVRNLSLNKRRSRRGNGLDQPLTDFDDNRLGPFVNDAGDDFTRREDAEMLRRAIALLPIEARELIVLRFIEEMPYAEIAKTLGSGEAAL